MAQRSWVIAALGWLGWTECSEDGDSLVFNNPRQAHSPIVWDPTTPGQALGPQ